MRKMAPIQTFALAWLFLLSLLAGTAAVRAASYQPPSQAESEAFGQKFVSVVNEGDTNEIVKLFDAEGLVERILAKLPERTKDTLAFFESAKEGYLTGVLRETTAGGAQFDFLRWQMEGENAQVLVRQFIETKGLFDYWHLTLGKRPDGTVRVIDSRTMFTGENVSDLVRRTMLPLLAELNKNLFEKFVGGQGEFAKAMPQWTEYGNLIQARKYSEAMALYAKMPPDVRNMKFIQVQRLRASQSMGSEEHSLALDHYARLFPGDPSLPFYYFYANLAVKKYPEALANVDQLDRLFSPDLFLNYLRARLHFLMKKEDAALELIRQAIGPDKEPDYKAKFYLELLVKNNLHDETVKFLAELESRHKIEMAEAVLGIPNRRSLVRSTAFQQWLNSPAKLPLPPELKSQLAREASGTPAPAAASPLPAAPAVAQPSPPAEPAPAYKLGGILYSKKSPAAIINGRTVYVGDRVGEAKVTVIEQQKVTLEINGKTEVLNLK